MSVDLRYKGQPPAHSSLAGNRRLHQNTSLVRQHRAPTPRIASHHTRSWAIIAVTAKVNLLIPGCSLVGAGHENGLRVGHIPRVRRPNVSDTHSPQLALPLLSVLTIFGIEFCDHAVQLSIGTHRELVVDQRFRWCGQYPELRRPWGRPMHIRADRALHSGVRFPP